MCSCSSTMIQNSLKKTLMKSIFSQFSPKSKWYQLKNRLFGGQSETVGFYFVVVVVVFVAFTCLFLFFVVVVLFVIFVFVLFCFLFCLLFLFFVFVLFCFVFGLFFFSFFFLCLNMIVFGVLSVLFILGKWFSYEIPWIHLPWTPTGGKYFGYLNVKTTRRVRLLRWLLTNICLA